MKTIKKATDAIRKELSEPLPDHKEKNMANKKKSKKNKKVSKKASKKIVKKGSKKTKRSKVEGVTLTQLAGEAKISGQKARQKLRAAGIEREAGGRWAWKEGSNALKKARKALDL
jgi:hypothetical protein